MEWKKTLIHLPLSGETVHVWAADLDLCQSLLSFADAILSQDELERAKRFYFAHDRDRFTTARLILRILLGFYLATDPRQITFDYNDYGKPFVENRRRERQTVFNVSHSQNQALFVFSQSHELGVDIEYMRPSFATIDIAKKYFSADELDDLQQVPERERVIRFYDCWTRKEAYIKAKGRGLSLALDSFSVDVLTDSKSGLRRSIHYPNDELKFSIQPLACAANFRAALAVNRIDYEYSHKPVDAKELATWFFSDSFV
ncbi:4'-phosphopantetheinyl transferase superfamily protein [candidate division KSB1 bacterium]|nr:4'-phosphopantetheinyl transferase superfamily protein [candidate division KSB1 bacterium]RQW04804.1 MAG: 4'-phosphopantetheinyl transferase superfamily protein [candidate division KSB1 bacterium]